MKLSNFTEGRANNFNLIRITAAFAVLITHSFAIAIGTGNAEPFRESLGMTIGSIAVDIFFITSGFLVTASLIKKQSIVDFFWARFLRIFPALLAMLFLTVFALGIFFTTLPIRSYLADSRTYTYLMKCATLITGVSYTLPEVFSKNPYKNAINGSLWTMPYEILMYAILLFIWTPFGIMRKSRSKLFELSIIISFVIASILMITTQFYNSPDGQFSKLFYMFFSGATFYVLKKYITISRPLFCFFVISLLSATILNKYIFFWTYTITIPYILFYVAYIPSGFIRKYNQVGDYSYGIYIYAFPLQQSVAALIPGISVLSMLIISSSATLLLAALSWHILERRALGLKGFYIGHTKNILSYSRTRQRS